MCLLEQLILISRRNTIHNRSQIHNQQKIIYHNQQNLSDLPRPNKRPRINQKDEMVSEALNIMKNISERQNASKILEKDEDGLFGD
ncbi:unnamed protein product [Parnassius apollo]|uniref:(apollo) hypothetical protein n=1 Tax=Parnassius apollo TaxID=110799 RepID=A0A8S3X7G4_PARAO|nr:unnamed protein product [Parnassius apollo]